MGGTGLAAIAVATGFAALAGGADARIAATAAVLLRICGFGLFQLTFGIFLHSGCCFFSVVSFRRFRVRDGTVNAFQLS